MKFDRPPKNIGFSDPSSAGFKEIRGMVEDVRSGRAAAVAQALDQAVLTNPTEAAKFKTLRSQLSKAAGAFDKAIPASYLHNAVQNIGPADVADVRKAYASYVRILSELEGAVSAPQPQKEAPIESTPEETLPPIPDSDVAIALPDSDSVLPPVPAEGSVIPLSAPEQIVEEAPASGKTARDKGRKRHSRSKGKTEEPKEEGSIVPSSSSEETPSRGAVAVVGGQELVPPPTESSETQGDGIIDAEFEPIPLGTEPAPLMIEHQPDVYKTPEETKEELRAAVEQFENRTDQREARAKAFAEQYGLAGVRQAMLDAEKTFKEARRKNVGGLVGAESAAFSNAKAEYLSAVQTWREAIDGKMSEGMTPEDQREARMISRRDTLLRPGQVNTESKYELLGDKGKKAVASVAGATLRVLNAPFRWIGEKTAGRLEGSAREAHIRRVARGAAILTGAAAASIVAVGFSPAALPLTFAVFAARGALSSIVGAAIGAGAAKIAGGVYERFFRGKSEKFSKEAMARQGMYNEDGSINSYYLQRAQQATRQNFLSRGRTKQGWQMGSALLGGFLGGRGAAMSFDAVYDTFFHSDAALTAKAEGKNLYTEPNPKGGGMEGGDAVKAPEGTASLYSETVRIGPGEGADAMFNKLQIQLRAEYPNPDTAPEAVKELLSKHPNELSREYGFAKGDWSKTMYEGDSLTFNKDGSLSFTRGSEAQVLAPVESRTPAPVTDTPERVSVPVSPEATPTDAVIPQTSGNGEVFVTQGGDLISEGGVLDINLAQKDSGITINDTNSSIDLSAKPEVSAPVEAPAPVPQPEAISTPAFRAPYEFPGMPTEPFTLKNGLTINPQEATVFRDTRGNFFVYGGTFEQQQAAATEFAKAHPRTLVQFEGRPIAESGELRRWTASAYADGGQVLAPTQPTMSSQWDRVPDPTKFTRVAR